MEYPRKQNDIYQRIWNTNGIFPQFTKIQLDPTSKSQDDEVTHHFYLDSRNKIQLLYPNYQQALKLEKVKNMIAEKCNITQTDSNIRNTITSFDLSGQTSNVSFVPLYIESLKQTLNDDTLNVSQ